MIAHLRGPIHKLDHGEVTVDVNGVGYRVSVPTSVWEDLKEAETRMLWIATYIREDRFDLFGFADRNGRTLFEAFLNIPGVGPRIALELCSVPRDLLLLAITKEDTKLLSTVKGVGKKTAETLLVELRQLAEKKPDLLRTEGTGPMPSAFDQDAVAALTGLGYDVSSAMRALRELPKNLKTTEERVAAALRSL